MQQPRGIAVILGVVISLGIIAVVGVGIILILRKPAVETVTNTNQALNLACTIDADCVSYCGADSCYQPICGTNSIGGTGSCTCRSLCGPIAPTTNTSVNTNAPGEAGSGSAGNTNSSVSTAGWKTYTDPRGIFSFKYPAGWAISTDVNATGLARPSIQVAVNPQSFSLPYTDVQYTVTKDTNGFLVTKEVQATGSEDQDTNLYEISVVEPNDTPGDKYTIMFRQDTLKKDGFDLLVKKILSTFTFTTTISTWKTYTSTLLAYSFKYPEFYTATAASDGTVILKSPAGTTVVDTRHRIDAVNGSLASWFDTAPVGDVKLGNRVGNKFIYKYCDGPSCGDDTVAFVVQHQGKLLGLEFVGDQEMNSTEQKILSTFTFLDETAGWKTYTDTTSSFSFRYPSGVTLSTTPDGLFQFCDGSSCYAVERSAITNRNTRETFWEDDQKIGTFQSSALNGVIYARSTSQAITVVLTSNFELHIIKRGSDGGGIGPSSTKDATFNGIESSVKIKNQSVY